MVDEKISSAVHQSSVNFIKGKSFSSKLSKCHLDYCNALHCQSFLQMVQNAAARLEGDYHSNTGLSALAICCSGFN